MICHSENTTVTATGGAVRQGEELWAPVVKRGITAALTSLDHEVEDTFQRFALGPVFNRAGREEGPTRVPRVDRGEPRIDFKVHDDEAVVVISQSIKLWAEEPAPAPIY